MEPPEVHGKRSSATIAPLEMLFETTRGQVVPLSPRLARLYGRLRMPLPRARPYVFSNFVTTLDGVVSFNTKGHASGGDISGFNIQDRMVMAQVRSSSIVARSGRPQPSFRSSRMNIVVCAKRWASRGRRSTLS